MSALRNKDRRTVYLLRINAARRIASRAGLPAELNAGRRQRIAADHPFGAGRENQQMPCRHNSLNDIDLIRQYAKLNCFIIQTGADVKIEQICRF